jgi:hypothetical protein
VPKIGKMQRCGPAAKPIPADDQNLHGSKPVAAAYIDRRLILRKDRAKARARAPGLK